MCIIDRWFRQGGANGLRAKHYTRARRTGKIRRGIDAL
jgi:hypothetical protein